MSAAASARTDSVMTVQVAREILKPPLRFGDPKQIEAVKILSALEELTELAHGGVKIHCPYCNFGLGCRRCGGYGRLSIKSIPDLHLQQLRSAVREAQREAAP